MTSPTRTTSTPADVLAGRATYALVEGDCLDPVSGLASLPDGCVDHMITDPPYEAEAHTLQRRVIRGTVTERYDSRSPECEPLPFDPMTEEARIGICVEAARLSRRWVIVFCQAEAVGIWRSSMESAGLRWKRAGIWVKPDGQPQLSGDRPGMGYESIAIGHAATASRWHGGGKHGIWRFTCLKGLNQSEHSRFHPTQKPLDLMQALVRDFTDPGELILDPFAGSGTTGVAALQTGRRFIGWEKSEKYAEIARRRLARAREQLEIPLLAKGA